MAFYLVIKNESTINRYLCEDTYNNTPYLKVSTDSTGGYLNLTTATTTGMRLNISNVTGNSTSMSTRESQYDETTGYSGVSSRESTSGYSGISSRTIETTTATFTSGISSYSPSYGYYSSTTDINNSTMTSKSGHGGPYSYIDYTYEEEFYDSLFSIRTYSDAYTVSYTYQKYTLENGNSYTETGYMGANTYTQLRSYNVSGTYRKSGGYFKGGFLCYSISTTQTKESMWYRNGLDAFYTYGYSTTTTFPGSGYSGARTYTLDNDNEYIYHTRSMGFGAANGPRYITQTSKFSTLSTTFYLYSTTGATFIGNIQTNSYYASATYTYTFTKSESVSKFSSTGEVFYTDTIEETYSTSSNEIGNLSSTTALTRSSNYSTSSIDIGNLSSTTALTVTSSRSSAWEKPITISTHYRPCNTETITITRTINEESSYYTGIKKYNSSNITTVTETNLSSITTGYSGVDTRYIAVTTATSYSGISSTMPSYNQAKTTSDMNYSTIESETSSNTYKNGNNYQYTRSASSTYTKHSTYEHMYRGSIAQTTFTLSSGVSNASTSYDDDSGTNILVSHGVTATYRNSSAYSQASTATHTMMVGSVTYSVSYGLDNYPDIYSTYGQLTSFTLPKRINNGQRSITLDNDQDCIYHTRHMTCTNKITRDASDYCSLETRFTLRSTTATEDCGQFVSLSFRVTSSYTYYSNVKLTATKWYNTGTIDMTSQGTDTETYNTTSSEIGHLSSTTALTSLTTENSTRTISSGETYKMSSHTTNNKMSSTSLITRESTSYTKTYEAIRNVNTPSSNNNLEAKLDAGFYN